MKCNLHSLIKFTLLFRNFNSSSSITSLDNKMFAKVIFQELGVSCVQFELKLVKAGQDHQLSYLGMPECLLSDILSSKSQKLHP